MITNIENVSGKLVVSIKPYIDSGDHTTIPFEPSVQAMGAQAEIGGYAVVYADGFKSISPKAAFEAGYSRI